MTETVEAITREQEFLHALKREAVEKADRQALWENYDYTMVYVGGLRFLVNLDGRAEWIME